MTRKRNKKYVPKRPKGRPWWRAVTPLDDETRRDLALDMYVHLSAVESGEYDDTDLGFIGGAIVMSREFAKRVEQEEEIQTLLADGWAAFLRAVKRWKKGNTQDPKDLGTLRQCVEVYDQFVHLLDRHEILNVTDKGAKLLENLVK